MKKRTKTILIIAIVLLLGVIALAVYIALSKPKEEKNEEIAEPVVVEEKKLQIVDLDSNERNIAVMINNINLARPYQSGLQDAYLVYEMIVEGGITRLMAVYRGSNATRIGSIRSSRHYYLDYVLENDAIYLHDGWSPQAQSDISKYGISDLNAVGTWREYDLPVDTEHTEFSSIEKIKEAATNYGYRLTSDQKLLLNYSIDEIDLSKDENAVKADEIDIEYSTYYVSNYEYDKTNKVYKRSVNDTPHTDYITKEQYTFKNIIIAYMDNTYIYGDNKGRQTLDNLGVGDGYYITDGYAIPITWEKASREAQTVYKKMDGTEIQVNDGNTFIQNAPEKSATIASIETEAEN